MAADSVINVNYNHLNLKKMLNKSVTYANCLKVHSKIERFHKIKRNEEEKKNGIFILKILWK